MEINPRPAVRHPTRKPEPAPDIPRATAGKKWTITPLLHTKPKSPRETEAPRPGPPPTATPIPQDSRRKQRAIPIPLYHFIDTAQKTKPSIKDFLSKGDQIRSSFIPWL